VPDDATVHSSGDGLFAALSGFGFWLFVLVAGCGVVRA
jgi:hypothetical protein